MTRVAKVYLSHSSLMKKLSLEMIALIQEEGIDPLDQTERGGGVDMTEE